MLGHFSPGTAPIRECTDKTKISTCTQVTHCNHTMDLGVVCKSHDQVVGILISEILQNCSKINFPDEIITDSQNQCNQNSPGENKNGQLADTMTTECPSSGQCDVVNNVLGVLVGLLTALLVTLLVSCTVIIRRNKLHTKQQYTKE